VMYLVIWETPCWQRFVQHSHAILPITHSGISVPRNYYLWGLKLPSGSTTGDSQVPSTLSDFQAHSTHHQTAVPVRFVISVASACSDVAWPPEQQSDWHSAPDSDSPYCLDLTTQLLADMVRMILALKSVSFRVRGENW
jgi:hypothetical protein